MQKSVKKIYEFHREAEYADAYGRSGHISRGIMKYVKKRSHKRVRSILKRTGGRKIV